MRKLLLATFFAMGTATLQTPVTANESVMKAVGNPANYALSTLDYANTRYSKLSDINAGNVGKLQVAWTFSTGVLRGHEGAPRICQERA